MSKQAVRVFAPATVANVAVGFDILGFALDKPGDEVIARWSKTPGLKISSISGTKKKLPRDIHKNTASRGVLELLRSLGRENEAIDLEIHKKMPFGTGMGSSAASAAAGVMAVNELLGRPIEKKDLAPFVVAGESAADDAYHGDNAIPSLMGGIILIRDNPSCDFIRLPAPLGLFVIVIYPEIEILTKNARLVLNDHVTMAQLISQTGNLGAFIASLYISDFELMRRSLDDCVIEPQRACLVPHFYELKEIALEKGAINYTISGSGPSMFGFCTDTLVAESVIEALQSFLQSKGVPSHAYISRINTRGAYKM